MNRTIGVPNSLLFPRLKNLTLIKKQEIFGFLRKAQFEALETYWYLRHVEGIPYIFDLYKKLYNDPENI